MNFICNFCKEMPKLPQNEILHICHLTYENEMNQVSLQR
jgi:hypothetical protein